MNLSEKHLTEQMTALKLVAVQEHYLSLASEAAQQQWTPVDYLARLIDLEATRRQELAWLTISSPSISWIQKLRNLGEAPARTIR